LHVPGRLAYGRSSILAITAAALGLVLVGSSTVFAANSATPLHLGPAKARSQHPGDATGYRLPFAPGLVVPIEQGWNSAYSHTGRAAYAYDFGLYIGTPVLAAANGVVTYTHTGETACGGPALLRHANYVTIAHADGSATQYGHLSTVKVRVGDVVSAGQQIGRSGDTGYTGCMPHLHFARQAQGGAVTQSVPVYFDGYDRELLNHEIITAPVPACSTKNTAAPLGAFCGTYAARTDENHALFTRLDGVIDFDWTTKAPGGYWLDQPVDGFSAQWSGTFNFGAGGDRVFHVVASDFVRIDVDGVTILNSWSYERAVGLSAELTVTPGIHRVDVHVYDADGRGILQVDLGDVTGTAHEALSNRYQALD
jgi:murein DD-endopeptidase MepM/ murein hydrolase activator NlpD